MDIGEIVSALMAEQDLTLQAVAERVRARGASNVKYQHIQQLLVFPRRRPRFLPELAAAFGMTVEQFLAYEPHQDATTVSEQRARYGGSHPLGITPEILAASTRLVRLACQNLEVEFDPEDAGDAGIVLLGVAYLRERQEVEVTADNVVDFTRMLRRRNQGAVTNESIPSARSAG